MILNNKLKSGLEELGDTPISTVFSNPGVYSLMRDTVVYKTGTSQTKKIQLPLS